MTTTTTAGIYSFGGVRQADGRPQPIQSNDRQFNCGFGICTALPALSAPVPQSELFNLDFELFDIAELRANLNRVSTEVGVAYRNIVQWFNTLEQNFALRVQTGDIAKNITLFNKLNLIIPKFAQGRKVLDSWYGDYIYMISALSDLFSEYSNASARLQSLRNQTTIVGGISENVITLAKQNLSRSKALQRSIARIISLDAQIRSSLQNVTFKLTELTSGILRYGDKKILNLIEMSTAISSLGEGDSPLVEIQSQLSQIINSTPLNFTLRTQPPEMLPTIDFDPARNYPASTMTADEALVKLRAFQDTILYTPTTKPTIDALHKYIDANFADDVNYPTLKRIVERIKVENLPTLFMDQLQARASNSNNIYLTIDVINQTIANLKGSDLVYRERLDNILSIAMETASSMMDVESTTIE